MPRTGLLRACALLSALALAAGCWQPNIPLMPEIGGTGHLPEDGFVPGWRRVSDVERYTGKSLEEYLGRQATRIRSYGFEMLYTADYRRPGDENPTLTVESYEMNSPLIASGLFHDHRGRLLRRRIEYRPVDVGVEGLAAERFLYFYKHRYFFKVIYAGPEADQPDLVTLGRAVARPLPGARRPPRGFEHLDVEGVNPAKSYVTPGNTFDYDFLPPAIMCEAPGAGEVARVFLIGHYEEDEAERTAEDYRTWLELNGLDYELQMVRDPHVRGRRLVWRARDPGQGRVVCTQVETWVIGVLAPETYERGQVILDRIAARIQRR